LNLTKDYETLLRSKKIELKQDALDQMIKLAYDAKVKNTKLNKLLSKHMTDDNLNSEYLAAILRVSEDAYDSEIV